MTNDNKISIRDINESITMLKNQTKTLEDFLKNIVSSHYHFDTSIIDDILPYTLEKIESMDESECREFISKYTNPTNFSKVLKELIEDENNSEIENENQAVHYILKDIKDMNLKILSAKLSIKNIEEESDKMMEEIITEYNSEESIEKRKNNLIKMQEEIEAEQDEEKKAEMIQKFTVISNSFTLDFFKERLDKFGDKEVKNIVDSFFDRSKSSYIINKYKNRISQINKINPNIYKKYFNIEQYFCGEEYYAYNNLFLFIYMRFIAHCDPYKKSDRIYAQAITTSISNLMYHRFSNDQYEQDMINLIKNIDDRFSKYHDDFEKYNLMNPNHPANKERLKKMDDETREKIKIAMAKYDITIEDFDSKTTEELQTILNNKINDIIVNQVNDYESKSKTDSEEPSEESNTDSTENVMEETTEIEV